MHEKIIFVRTLRGEDELRSGTAHLSKDLKRALLRVDGATSVAQIKKRASPGLRDMLEAMLTELLKDGFIEENSHSEHAEQKTTVGERLSVRKEPFEQEPESGLMLATLISLNEKNAAREAGVFSELDELIKKAASADQTGSLPAMERRKTDPAVQGCDSRGGNNGVPLLERRVITVAVVFLDIVGFTKQSDSIQFVVKQKFNQLLLRSLGTLAPQEWLILDTGDGAAIGFLQHPTEAMSTAMRFRAELPTDGTLDDLRVRIGVNLGPVSLVKDINGQINMLGDGINSAQRVMSFAGENQIYVSRAYVDFVSSLSNEYARLFRYRGALQDKHGREHQVYELLADEVGLDDAAPIPGGNTDAFNFEAFNLDILSPPQSVNLAEVHLVEEDAAASQLACLAAYMTASLPEHADEHAAGVRVFAKAATLVVPAILPEPVVLVKAAVACRPAIPVAPPPLAAPFAPADKKTAQITIKRLPHKTGQPQGARLAGLLILLLLALLIVPLVWQMQSYLAGIEQRLSEKIHQPVHIGHLSGRILPLPELTLSDVSIGWTGEIQLSRVQVNFGITTLFEPIKLISSVEIDGVQVQGAALPQVSAWLQQVADDPLYPIRRIALTRGQLEVDGVALSTVEGVLEFDSKGEFSSANFTDGEHKISLQLRALPAEKLALTFALHDRALPALPNLIFDGFKADGKLGRDELHLTSFDGEVGGGILTGSANIHWRHGWRVQGDLVAKGMPLQKVNKLLAGDADGSAHFAMRAATLANLAGTGTVSGVFHVQKGFINGVNIVESARLHSQKNLPGGRTYFDEMSGHFSYANGDYRFDPLKLNDSMLKAAGALTVTGAVLSGNISAELAMRAGSVALQISGTTDSPSIQLAP